MATYGTYSLSLAEAVKRCDKDGKVLPIAEMLSQVNGVVADTKWVECNEGISNLGSVRTGLPTLYWSLVGQAVATSKSTTAQLRETCGKLEGWSEISTDLLELQSDKETFLMSEANAFAEAMAQEYASTLFYGNSGTAPEEFTGLSARYSSLSATNAQNIVSAGGAGSHQCSIWIVKWGDKVHGLYPKGTPAGLQHEDKGEQIIDGASTPSGIAGAAGTRLSVKTSRWKWQCGLHLGDWRDVVRICNIDQPDLLAGTAASWLAKYLIKGLKRLNSPNSGTTRIYMNRTCEEALDLQRLNVMSGAVGFNPTAFNGTGFVNIKDTDGQWVPSFQGIPIRTCDALLETEAAVS